MQGALWVTLRGRCSELWDWARSLSWGEGSSPVSLQGRSWSLFLWGMVPRRPTGINPLTGRGTQEGRGCVLELTVPTRALTPSCRIYKENVPTEPRCEGGAEHTVRSALGASSWEVSSPLTLLKTHSPKYHSGNVHYTADGLLLLLLLSRFSCI